MPEAGRTAAVWEEAGVPQEAEPRASVSTPQGQQVPRGNTQAKVTTSRVSTWTLQGRNWMNCHHSCHQDPESREGSASRLQMPFFARQ